MSDVKTELKSVPVREICKSWPKVLRQHAGSEIAVTSRGERVAYLRIPARKKGQKVKIPDFRSRLRANFGDKVLSECDAAWLDEANKGQH